MNHRPEEFLRLPEDFQRDPPAPCPGTVCWLVLCGTLVVVGLGIVGYVVLA
jgi:hypothetical protein